MIELFIGGLGGIIASSIIHLIKSRVDKNKEITIEEHKNNLIKELEEHKNLINRKQFYLDNFYQDYRDIYSKMYDIQSTIETFKDAEEIFTFTNENAEKYVTLSENQIKDYQYGDNLHLVKKVNYLMNMQILADDIIDIRFKIKSSSLLFDNEENELLNNFLILSNKTLFYLREYTSINIQNLISEENVMNQEVVESNLANLRKYTEDIKIKFRNRFVFN